MWQSGYQLNHNTSLVVTHVSWLEGLCEHGKTPLCLCGNVQNHLPTFDAHGFGLRLCRLLQKPIKAASGFFNSGLPLSSQKLRHCSSDAAISWLSSVFINANNLRTCLSVTNPPPLR